MIKEKAVEKHTTLVSASFERTAERCVYELPFRRWLVMQIEEQKMTVPQAIERFNFSPQSGYQLLRDWRAKYAPQMATLMKMLLLKG